MKRQNVALLLSLLVAGVSLSACVERVVEERPVPVREVVVQQAPPPEMVEPPPPPPPPGPPDLWVWQKGHWRWNGHDYHWVRGRWVERPPHVTVWQPPHWEPRGGGYVFIEGSWR